ncbi:MAG: KpsF/GutQ family sugar-phosphate isomerase [Bacteroidales bacterium]|nr:KpsF/GutQ family sugar-phosphate isomerase [Bacteroidales bacterium]NLM93572.1 KpsF/GutQ family sugar-phosphate isomerase [Bacteroidales bacterium]
MKSSEEIQAIALQTIETELVAINNLKGYIDNDFARCIESILHCKGRVVITGIGKSAIIAQKIVATFNSTGTPAIFMHAADAIHGDLGIVQPDDIVICISNSGNTPEIKVLTPMLKSLGALLIGMVGNVHSYLARQADLIINTAVEMEATPGNPAPTSSTTAQLVMGDAMAVALLQCRGFSTSDFARYHPGGSLGKQLYIRVNHLYPSNEKPQVQKDTPLREVIIEISGKLLGTTAVLDGKNLVGIITDGDLRRMLQRNTDLGNVKASDIMSPNPKTISGETLAVDALQLMRKHNITQLLVVDDNNYKGVVHLHDILNEGII